MDILEKIDAYWRASNYLSVGQIYLYDNPLLKKPLVLEHIKPTLIGHWGTTPGQNFIYTHLNRVITAYDLNMIYVSGPGHGAPALVSHSYLEGSYTEIYPHITQDEAGLKALFKQFSFPGGISSHVAPGVPGSIHEGGELGYSLSHAFGAAFDNPSLIVACVVGDGEAETAALATSWHSNKFLNPATDGAVLPILHLNGYKIANPTLFARIEEKELEQFFYGCGWQPYIVSAETIESMHQEMFTILDTVIARIQEIQKQARSKNESISRPHWPMIILKSPKGWTGPRYLEGLPIESSWRSHQVPLLINEHYPERIALLEAWMKSYKPETLFDEKGKLKQEILELAPSGQRRMGRNPHANGGLLLHDLVMPDFRSFALEVTSPGKQEAEDTRVLGKFLTAIMEENLRNRNFRIFGPDETRSNRLDAVFEATANQWMARIRPDDQNLKSQGYVIDGMLSEHQCQGWLEGYLLTGRHGLFNCYEAFIRIVDSMCTQYAKWLKVCAELPWRKDIASLNYLLSSHVWQQDHNGFTHQDPGFLDHVVNKKPNVVRIYLPPDANCLLSVTDHCLRSRNYINVIVASKHSRPQWLSMAAAIEHCRKGIDIWQWVSSPGNADPDVVLACCGETPTLETIAAVTLLREHLPKIRVRVINVVDLLRLQSPEEHPHGLCHEDYDAFFTKKQPIIFAFHGYPTLIHRLTYRRANKNLHVCGYQEEGTITTPFDLRVQNKLDRFNLVLKVIQYLPNEDNKIRKIRQLMNEKLIAHKHYIVKYGQDLPEIRDWHL